MWYFVILCDIMLYYVILHYIMLYYVLLYYFVLCYVILCYIMCVCMLCYFYFIQCYVALYYVMLYCIVWYCIVIYYIVCMYVCLSVCMYIMSMGPHCSNESSTPKGYVLLEICERYLFRGFRETTADWANLLQIRSPKLGGCKTPQF